MIISLIARVALGSIWFLANACPASAQSVTSPPLEGLSGPTVGGTSGMRNGLRIRPSFGASSGVAVLRHRDFTGKPCLEINGFARPHISGSNLYDHVVNAINNCPQRIAMQVCYYHSDECVPVDIPGHEHKEVILGSLPSAKDFRFEFREKF